MIGSNAYWIQVEFRLWSMNFEIYVLDFNWIFYTVYITAYNNSQMLVLGEYLDIHIIADTVTANR